VKRGCEPRKIKTLHGIYTVHNQRYRLENGQETSFLGEYGELRKGGQSVGLGTFVEHWSQRLSYRGMAGLLDFVVGHRQGLGKNGIKNTLKRRAIKLSTNWAAQSPSLGRAVEAEAEGVIEGSADLLYDGQGPEVIVMMDDVGVKAQKPHHNVARKAEDVKRIDTTVALVERAQKGEFEVITEGVDANGEVIYPITAGIRDSLERHHGVRSAIPVVAITDGARSIRVTLEAVFGPSVCIVLDWYHLQHKVSAMMTMIAHNKADKELLIRDISGLLWGGDVAAAVAKLDQATGVRNVGKQRELREYLLKHQCEIINYRRRQRVGKTIGSGRGEKANDIVVAHRQKRKGMAWSPVGSKALAIIRVDQLREKKRAA
jgi:hypothetical protein